MSGDKSDGNPETLEILRSTSEELQNTLENQLEAYRGLNQRAIDLVKINLIGPSVVFTGISVGRIPLNIPVVSGFVSLSYGIWSCFRIYNPSPLYRGLGPDDIDTIDDMAINDPDNVEHYRELMYGFKNSINSFSDTLSDEVDKMRNAIWATILSIWFFIVSIIKSLAPSYPAGADLIWVVVLPIVALWGRYKYVTEKDNV